MYAFTVTFETQVSIVNQKIETLEMMDNLTSESKLTESDVQEIANKINERGRERVEEEIGVDVTTGAGH